jgi:hypothetical protein
MSKSLPFHSVKRGAPQVFHNNDECDEGKRVEPANWRAGDGGRSLCRECVRRNAAARPRPPQSPQPSLAAVSDAHGGR